MCIAYVLAKLVVPGREPREGIGPHLGTTNPTRISQSRTGTLYDNILPKSSALRLVLLLRLPNLFFGLVLVIVITSELEKEIAEAVQVPGRFSRFLVGF